MVEDLLPVERWNAGQNQKEIVLVGNPNVGKSVIFNQLTGANQKVANFPGITLNYLKGKMSIDEQDYQVVDLPGFYGFSSSKVEENVAYEYLHQQEPDLVLNIIDARKLERGLSLTLQLLEQELPIVVILSFNDKISDSIDTNSLTQQLGCPVVAVNSHATHDIEALKGLINCTQNRCKRNCHSIPEKQIKFTPDEPMIAELMAKLQPPTLILADINRGEFSQSWQVIYSILNGFRPNTLLPTWIYAQLEGVLFDKYGQNYVSVVQELQISLLHSYYKRAEELAKAVRIDTRQSHHTLTTKIDAFLLHPLAGMITFVAIMLVIFTSTFNLAEPISAMMEVALGWLATLVEANLTNELLVSLINDGIIGGIGFVLIFIPQIAILFLFIGIMEQSGYLSRVIFVTEYHLRKIGISGSAVAPMLLGFGCNVPGIMATQAIEDPNERIAVALVNPFMSCSARLPVYVIITSAIFPAYHGLVLTSLYLLGIAVALISLVILRRTILKGNSPYLLMELPDLQVPQVRDLFLQVWRHVRKFIGNAASWMAAGILVLWLLSVTGPEGYIGPTGLQSDIHQSWIFAMGELISPIFAPMGWDVRLVVALILGFIAKEIVIGSLGLLYGLAGSASLDAVLLTEFNVISAYAFMVFVLLYTPCIGTFFAMRQEIGKKWTTFSVMVSIILAYSLALLISAISWI